MALAELEESWLGGAGLTRDSSFHHLRYSPRRIREPDRMVSRSSSWSICRRILATSFSRGDTSPCDSRILGLGVCLEFSLVLRNRLCGDKSWTLARSCFDRGVTAFPN